MDAGFPVSFLYGLVVVALLACCFVRGRRKKARLAQANGTIATPPGSSLVTVNGQTILITTTRAYDLAANAPSSQTTDNRADSRRLSRSSQRAPSAAVARVPPTLELPPPIYQAASLDRRVTSTAMPPPPPPPSYSRSTTATQSSPHSIIQMEELVPPQTPTATRRIILSSASPSLPDPVFSPAAVV